MDANQVGTAGEFAVALDLVMKGYRVSMASPGYPYDLLVEVDKKVYRLQVKATSKTSRISEYIFRTFGYKHKDYDLIAFVALDKDKPIIGYLPYFQASQNTNRFQQPGTPYHDRRKGKNLDDNSLEDAISQLASYQAG